MDKRVEYCVKKLLEDKKLNNVQIEVANGLKTDGYLGDMAFVKVTATTWSGEIITYHLVLKLGKDNEYFRQSIPARDAYEQEIYMYEVVFPFYEKFQQDKGLETFDAIPRCYGTFKKEEVLVLENLKHFGYEMHPRNKPMNVNHIQIVLKEYGKWHALSFAMNDQRKEDYQKITSPLRNVFLETLKSKDILAFFSSGLKKSRDVLEEYKDYELLRKFNNATKRGDFVLFYELLDAREDKNVIVHGDCWNNNFLFKYKEDNSDSPKKVVLLDWQTTFPRSPVFDLSYHIYAVSSKAELDYFDHLIHVYYQSLTDTIKKLGSNPEKLFTYSELMQHWKKYSLFGMLMGLSMLPFMICNLEDAPTLEDQHYADKLDFEIPNKDEYYHRIRNIVEHYFSFQDIP